MDSGPWDSYLVSLLTCSCLWKNELKTGKLDHKHRAEYFLKHLGRSDEWVKEVVEALALKERKKKEKATQENRGQELTRWFCFFWWTKG